MLQILADCGFAIALTFFVIFAIKSYRRKQQQDKMLGNVILASTLVLTFYFLNCNARFDMSKAVFASLEHVACIWALFFLIIYTCLFTRRKINNYSVLAVIGILVVDSVLLITNQINKFIADVIIIRGKIFSTAIFAPRPIYIYHVLCVVLLILTQFVLLIKTIKDTPKFNRTRYFAYFLAAVCIAIPTLIFAVSGGFSAATTRWAYAIGVAIIYFDTYVYMPARIENAYMRFVDDSVFDATLVFDEEGKLVHLNAAAKALFAESEINSVESFLKLLKNPKEGSFKYAVDKKAYNVIYKRIKDENDSLLAYSFVFHDITDEENREEREHIITIFDPLTKVYNRIGFFEGAREFLKEHGKEGNYAVMVSGIIDFKGLNSLYGSKVGDKVLLEISDKLHKAHHDFPMLYGRTAEGKFASVLPFEHIDTVAEALNCTSVHLGDGLDVHADMCHGFVVMDDDIKSPDYYYELAIIALDKCKAKAGSSILEYSDDMEENQHRKQMLLSEMHNAIQEGQFYVELQPQIDLVENRVSGAEALVRWNHPTLGRIAPFEFIPLFESNGFISNLDMFVWEEAASTIARLTKNGIYDGPISVNVSQIDIMNLNIPEVLYEITMKHHIPVEKLHVEITESAYADNPELLVRTMNALREKGFVVEVDDFGSGYSSLYSLIKLPFDVVKLDMMFMKQASEDKKSDIVIESIVKMIHGLGAKIIVEGVEYENNALMSKTYGCDVAQGYFYSRPISVSDFEMFVKQY